uniref:PKD domain-containing protein n=1 Tax=Electrophorus electricus TaxID=8005 RepID=A0A4W4F072_ELEEL
KLCLPYAIIALITLFQKDPFPFLISGWDQDTNPWDELLYPPFKQETKHRYGKPHVRLTSNSPAMNGSCLTFTAKLEFPRCQKKDSSGNLVYDEYCVNADGQLLSGYVYNWMSWLDDYGFGRCTDLKRCNVFPDGKPFPQHSDWRRRDYVYVWHTMGQYFETCDGSSSSLTLSTTNWAFGAGVMEVMVYHKSEWRKYFPFSTDSTVFIITDHIPLFVNISQKEAENITEKNVFIKGYDIIFKVQIHDPSSYLRTADTVDFIWTFGDGNQLVTHSNIATHAYGTLGNITVKLIVKAAFRTKCPPPTPPPTHFSLPYTGKEDIHKCTCTHTCTHTEMDVFPFHLIVITSPSPSTELSPTYPEMTTNMTLNGTMTTDSGVGSSNMVQHIHITESECFCDMYGTFEDQIVIIGKYLNTSPHLHDIVYCSHGALFLSTWASLLSSVCTTMADSTCRQVMSIMCDDVNSPDEGCHVSLKCTFHEPGTYCVNITLGLPGGLAFTTTTVTIGNISGNGKSRDLDQLAMTMLACGAVLLVIFAFITFFVYKRYKVYRLARRPRLEDTNGDDLVRSPLSRLRVLLFPVNEEQSHLLTNRHL